jgi:glycosyltransferase involved in cell wall biosynthesis
MPEKNYELDYTIVIFTYNPDAHILSRCLEAVSKLNLWEIKTEFLLIDNNSTIPVGNHVYVQEYLKKIPGITIKYVKEQGLQYARIAAIEQAQGRFVIFFDYDNEPDEQYVQELKRMHTLYPQVGAWGPGNINVDFTGGISKRIEAYARTAFQERHNKEIEFAKIKEWQSCYPYGSGLCMYLPLLKKYAALANAGTLTLPGRKGNALTSGEDTQMVLLCIKEGYAAGVSPGLQLTHIIPANRNSTTYLQRLTYATSSCYETCMVQVFPEHKEALEKKVLSPATFSRRAFKKLVKAKLQSDPLHLLNVVFFIGINAGVYFALERTLPLTVKKIIRYLKID